MFQFSSHVLGERRPPGLADISPVTGFLLLFEIGVFLRSATCPDTDSSMKTCYKKTIVSEFPAQSRKG